MAKIIYLTLDTGHNGYVDVWLSAPTSKIADTFCQVWGLWDDHGDWPGYVGEFKAEIVKRIFGVVPIDEWVCMQVEVDPQRILLDELNN